MRLVLVLPLLFSFLAPAALFSSTNILRDREVIGFVGGADVASAQESGHLESLLMIAFPLKDLQFRNFGWEGDTVFAQPRDFGFPPLKEHLRKAGVTLLFIQFGRAESLGDSLEAFSSAYRRFLDDLGELPIRLVLVLPPPFEDGRGLLPKLSAKNSKLLQFNQVIREIARERGLRSIDLFGPLQGQNGLTDDGLQYTLKGHAVTAAAFVSALSASPASPPVVKDDGCWSDPQAEELRQLIVEKNRLWQNYWRPQNWAFLGGDRTSQPSSRDHRDPQKRWFPEEIEKFHELLRAKEAIIWQKARQR